MVFILRRASGEEVEVTLRRNAGKLKLDTDVQVQELSLAVALLEDEKRMLGEDLAHGRGPHARPQPAH